MNVSMKDFYGQNVNINNETASGNIRLRVRTMKELNKVKLVTEDACDTETDISLTYTQAKFLQMVIQVMLGDEE
jgi:hypothetical protein